MLCPVYFGSIAIFFCVCLPIGQVAEKSKRKTDAVEDPQIRGGNGWLNGKKSWFNNG